MLTEDWLESLASLIASQDVDVGGIRAGGALADTDRSIERPWLIGEPWMPQDLGVSELHDKTSGSVDLQLAPAGDILVEVKNKHARTRPASKSDSQQYASATGTGRLQTSCGYDALPHPAGR